MTVIDRCKKCGGVRTLDFDIDVLLCTCRDSPILAAREPYDEEEEVDIEIYVDEPVR